MADGLLAFANVDHSLPACSEVALQALGVPWWRGGRAALQHGPLHQVRVVEAVGIIRPDEQQPEEEERMDLASKRTRRRAPGKRPAAGSND